MYKFTKIFLNPVLYFLLPTFIAHSAYAQGLKPTPGTVKHNGSQVACWTVHVDPEPKTLKTAWKDYLDENYNFKLKGIGFLANKDVLSAEEVKLSTLSPNTVYFFTQIVEDDAGSEMKVFASNHQQKFYSKNHKPESFNEIRDLMESFLKAYLPQYHQGRIEDTHKRVQELTKETADLEADIVKNSEKIEELNSEIEELQSEMDSNKGKLEENRIKLEKRKQKLELKRRQLQSL